MTLVESYLTVSDVLSEGECLGDGSGVTRHRESTVERMECVPQGGNWEDIPSELQTASMRRGESHSNRYRRLNPMKPSVTIANWRKSMVIHPWESRILSVREAARLQSYPDWFGFCGSLGDRQQQVANSVPPRLAQRLSEVIA